MAAATLDPLAAAQAEHKVDVGTEDLGQPQDIGLGQPGCSGRFKQRTGNGSLGQMSGLHNGLGHQCGIEGVADAPHSQGLCRGYLTLQPNQTAFAGNNAHVLARYQAIQPSAGLVERATSLADKKE